MDGKSIFAQFFGHKNTLIFCKDENVEMTYQNSETQKLMAEMNDWFVKTCGIIVERNLAMDLLESDFNGEFDAFIQPIVDASTILP